MIGPKQSAWEEPSKLPEDWKAGIKSLNQLSSFFTLFHKLQVKIFLIKKTFLL
jgi:hypothetical protein